MADNTAEAPSDSKPSVPVNPDRVGEELADDANIWHVYDKVAREDDGRRTKAWDTGLNNLALFAGLFSAVTTAFIIEARHDMEPDYAQLTFLAANATSYGEKFVEAPFVIPTNARAVTCLWVASLVLSLSGALIAIMGKDWIGMYTARPVCNLRQWAEMRTYRLRCVEGWYMSGVIAAAPVLLHVSLILFGVGLVLFISSDPLTRHLTIGLSLAAGGLYLVTTLSAVVFSASPFKSPATQMARGALCALSSSISTVIYRRKRKPIDALVRAMNAMFYGGTSSLPGCAPEKVQWYTGPREAVFRQGEAVLSSMRKIPAWVRTVRNNLQWSRVRSWLPSIASSARRLSFDWFLSSTWSDLPVDSRPELLAGALSWLSGASQAPDVVRAVVFALGDLDVGPQVGKHTSPELRTRLRAEIRRTWKRVDFLTLAHYVLADQNTPGNPALDYDQFTGRFDMSKEPALRCEDGLAAVIRVDPDNIYYLDLEQYSPDHVAQPRMLEFLLSDVPKTQWRHTDFLILLSNRYRTHLRTINSFNLGNLEAHLYETLDHHTREEYATAVTVKYGGTAGAIELLTFLCCNDVIVYVAKQAAVELVMELIECLPFREHRCLIYLFGSDELWDATWKDKDWSDVILSRLSLSIGTSCLHPCDPSSVRTLSDDREFDLALARTVVTLLSPYNNGYAWESSLIEFLYGHLCQSSSPSLLDNDEGPDVIRLILKNASLLKIVHLPSWYGFHPTIDIWSTSILAAIIRDLGRRLADPGSKDDAEQLLKAVAHTEVERPDGENRTWDLGEWLLTRALGGLTRSSSSTAMQDLHDALCALYPLCELNSELRVHWDRIGYPGRPGDIESEFFAIIEDPDSRREMYGSEESSDDEE